jgi:hypothetical protein
LIFQRGLEELAQLRFHNQRDLDLHPRLVFTLGHLQHLESKQQLEAYRYSNQVQFVSQTQIWDEDPDLFDYENEVEPILQVLVGKSIEHARIEIIESYE